MCILDVTLWAWNSDKEKTETEKHSDYAIAHWSRLLAVYTVTL